MENSNLTFRSWLYCMKYMTMTKKGVSAKEMQHLIGFKRCEPVWYMMHKLRAVMGKRDDLYTLSESIEIDEGFLKLPIKQNKILKNKILMMLKSKKDEVVNKPRS